MSDLYDKDEVELVDALRRDLGEAAFNATLRRHPNAQPFRAEDGILRIRLGEVELWLDEDGRTCYGVAIGTDLHTGYVADDELTHDAPVRLWHPS